MSSAKTEALLQPQPLPTYSDKHHVDGKYTNEPTSLYSELIREGNHTIFTFMGGGNDYLEPVPMRKIDPSEWATPGIRFWWIGHATCLFQFGQTFVITDPIYSNYAAPVPVMFKRTTPAAIPIDELPPISYVILSHDHYDHLDRKAMLKLGKRFPNMTVLAGLGLAEMMQEWGLHAIPFDWRQTLTLNDITFTCMPARHYTNRRGYDACWRLWCSFLISYQDVII